MKTIPILIATRTDHGLLRIWCRYCNRHHTHGGDGGHRVAHCQREDSPYLRTGYELLVTDDAAGETGPQPHALRLVGKKRAA